MPFVRQKLFIQEPIKAITFIEQMGYTPKQAQKIIDKARLRLPNNHLVKKSQIIQGSIYLTHFSSHFFTPDELIEPFIDTKDFVVFNKPSKLLTHPKGSFLHKSLIDSIRYYVGSSAQPIHRLDYETSGLLLVSKDKQGERNLKGVFASKEVQKTYLAQVSGHIKKPLIINAPILSPSKADKKSKNLSIRSKISPQGKEAITKITPIKYTPDSTFLAAQPLTGRTHQIRIHLAHIQHPIINDCLYGCTNEVSERYLDEVKESLAQGLSDRYEYVNKILHLHSYYLGFGYNGVRYSFYAPYPQWWSRDSH